MCDASLLFDLITEVHHIEFSDPGLSSLASIFQSSFSHSSIVYVGICLLMIDYFNLVYLQAMCKASKLCNAYLFSQEVDQSAL